MKGLVRGPLLVGGLGPGPPGPPPLNSALVCVSFIHVFRDVRKRDNDDDVGMQPVYHTRYR